MKNGSYLDFKTMFVYGAIATLLWASFYLLNDWVFQTIEVSSFVCWIFLPAAIRLVTVLVMGWPAAIGLMLGTFLTSNPIYGFNFIENGAFSFLSGIGPLIAVTICIRLLQLPSDLRGLQARDFALFSLVGAACNVIPHTLLLLALHKIEDIYGNAFPMFVGDVAGTFIFLYLASMALQLTPIDRSR